MGETNKDSEDAIKDAIIKEEGLGNVVPKDVKKNISSQEVVPDNVGWKPIPKDSIPSELKYNKDGETLRIKSCDFEHIKHYSMMNEEDPTSIDEHINEILAKNCKLGTNGNYMDLTITDKLHVFFTIRDYTMMNNESNNKIFMNFTSSKGLKKKIEIDAKVFEYFDIPAGIMKWYDSDRRCFVVKDETMSREIVVYVPKVGVINKMKKYSENIQSRKNRGENVYLDKEFVIYSQYLIDDWRKIDEDFDYVEKIRKEFTEYTPEELQIFDYVVSKLKVGIKPTIKVRFDDGNIEVFPLMFREYKSLFYLSNKIRTLFEA
jgi:hypothetical protein